MPKTRCNRRGRSKGQFYCDGTLEAVQYLRRHILLFVAVTAIVQAPLTTS